MPPAVGALVVGGNPPKITAGCRRTATVGLDYLHQVTVSGTAPVVVTARACRRGCPTTTVAAHDRRHADAGRHLPRELRRHQRRPAERAADSTIAIRTPPLVIITNSLPPIRDGDNVGVPIVAQGGVPPYTFDLLSGQLPPGLAFDPQGLLTGVPTMPGTFTFTVRVTDSVGTKATHIYTIVIAKGTTASRSISRPIRRWRGRPWSPPRR